MSDLADLDVSRETMAKLRLFSDLLIKWSKKINLIAPSTFDDVWDRHIRDSLQIFPTAPFATWLDLGSGGGLPGLVCAIVAQEKSPETQFTLVESDTRKVVFLRTAIREFDLQADAIQERIENITPHKSDIITARALKPLSQLLAFSEPHTTTQTRLIFPKGRTWEAEVDQARSDWTFDLEARPSITDPEARILYLRNIQRVGT